MKSLSTEKIPKWLQCFILVLIIFILLKILITQYDPETGFSSLIVFGQKYEPYILDPLKTVPRAIYAGSGYDGQFYVQLALDPLLNDPKLATASDFPAYRARRIFLPLLTFLITGGDPYKTVQVYALLNPLFFILLIVGFLKYIKPTNFQGYLCLFALTCTIGVVTSISGSLPDFPAVVLLFFANLVPAPFNLVLLSVSFLTKESGLLAVFSVIWPEKARVKDISKLLFKIGSVSLPIFLWAVFTAIKLPGGTEIERMVIEWPFLPLINHFISSLRSFISTFNFYYLGEVLAMVSLIFQSIYFFKNRLIKSSFWRMGVTFALLFYLFGNAVFMEKASYVRAMLPMTYAFNILTLSKDTKSFIKWYLLGNLGLFLNIL